MRSLCSFFRLKRAKRIAMVLMDVDGTLTDGTLYLMPDGQEIKGYNVQDGLGIFLAKLAGLKVGIITGKTSAALEIRSQRLGVDEFHQGILDKNKVLLEIAERHGLSLDQIAYIGDDLGDLEVMQSVGFAAAVADAHPLTKKIARFVCRKKGGQGAVREFIEFILRAQGKWEELQLRAKEIKRDFQRE